MFTSVEEKLIRLALDDAAQPGEVRNCAVKFVQSLRRRGIKSEALVRPLPPPTRFCVELDRARILKMPFGRHRGRRLDVIEPDYLKWALANCRCLSLSLREAIGLVLSAGSAQHR
jgi:hypothetical protein